MFDYALDRRGDVGSWVREESMRTLTSLVQALSLVCQSQEQWSTSFEPAMQLTLRQFYEKYIGHLL